MQKTENRGKKVNQDFFNQLCSIAGSDNTYTDEPMKKHTTFRIGGPADYFVTPHSKEEIVQLIQTCRREHKPFYILGNGSNLLVGDRGYRGVIIQIFKNFNDIVTEETLITAKAGALLSKIAKKAMERGLTGFEFASGIPGTLGGAAVMNAGAYGGEMKDVMEEVTALDNEGNILILQKEELKMGYRTSAVAQKGYIVLEAKLRLRNGSREQVSQRMEELKKQRTTKQPLEFPSAGSTFKRPQGHFAGKLIMDAGLQGFRVGGAQVSEKHCGFVINTGEATAQDVRTLMQNVTERVEEKFGVVLEPEVKMLGEF